jgi:DNA-binding NarL/FixJ family response regulator
MNRRTFLQAGLLAPLAESCAVPTVHHLTPDTPEPDALLYTHAPGVLSPLTALATLRNRWHGLPAILVYAEPLSEEQAFAALRVGYNGGLDVAAPADAWLGTAATVMRGGYAWTEPAVWLIEPAVSPETVFRHTPARQEVQRYCPLSRSELRVMDLIARGYDHAEVARHIGITVHTIKNQVNRVLRVLHCGNAVHAVAYCLERGWLVDCTWEEPLRMLTEKGA